MELDYIIRQFYTGLTHSRHSACSCEGMTGNSVGGEHTEGSSCEGFSSDLIGEGHGDVAVPLLTWKPGGSIVSNDSVPNAWKVDDSRKLHEAALTLNSTNIELDSVSCDGDYEENYNEEHMSGFLSLCSSCLQARYQAHDDEHLVPVSYTLRFPKIREKLGKEDLA